MYVEIVLHKGQDGKFYQIIFILKDKKEGREAHAHCFDRKVNKKRGNITYYKALKTHKKAV